MSRKFSHKKQDIENRIQNIAKANKKKKETAKERFTLTKHFKKCLQARFLG